MFRYIFLEYLILLVLSLLHLFLLYVILNLFFHFKYFCIHQYRLLLNLGLAFLFILKAELLIFLVKLFQKLVIQNILLVLIILCVLLILLMQDLLNVFEYFQTIFIAKMQSLARLSHNNFIQIVHDTTNFFLKHNFCVGLLNILKFDKINNITDPNKKSNCCNLRKYNRLNAFINVIYIDII